MLKSWIDIWSIQFFFVPLQRKTNNIKDMISRSETLKLIKQKVDERTNKSIKLKKPFSSTFLEGMFKHEETRRVVKLIKNGNSTMWVDDTSAVRNITVMPTSDLHKILWQLISDKEKKEIALQHLLETKKYLA